MENGQSCSRVRRAFIVRAVSSAHSSGPSFPTRPPLPQSRDSLGAPTWVYALDHRVDRDTDGRVCCVETDGLWMNNFVVIPFRFVPDRGWVRPGESRGDNATATEGIVAVVVILVVGLCTTRASTHYHQVSTQIVTLNEKLSHVGQLELPAAPTSKLRSTPPNYG